MKVYVILDKNTIKMNAGVSVKYYMIGVLPKTVIHGIHWYIDCVCEKACKIDKHLDIKVVPVKRSIW